MDSLYATPENVTDRDGCTFYHTMAIPGHGVVKGEWDLRGMERTYLGNVDFRNKRVLEIGPASGFFSFYMEREGAEVISLELGSGHPWGGVGQASDPRSFDSAGADVWRTRRNNSFWFAHRAFNSKVRVVYGNVYETPAAIGPVQIATFGSVLLHLRDPFLALQQALRLTTETVIVTDAVAERFRSPLPRFLRRFKVLRDIVERNYWRVKLYDCMAKESMLFLPRGRDLSEPGHTWWGLSPGIVKLFLAVLGFRQSSVSYHTQRYRETDRIPHFTVVGHRTDKI